MKVNVDFLKKSLDDKGLSKREFCKQCKISNTTLQKFFSGETNCNIVIVYKILDFLNCKFNNLFIYK